MNVTNLLDYALPYSADDLRCGMKKLAKTKRRMQLAALLNDKRNGRNVDLSKVEIMIDYTTFEQRVNAWIAGLKTS